MVSNVVVRVRSDESFERALKRFKRKCDREGVTKEVKDRLFHRTPGRKRHLAELKRIAREKKPHQKHKKPSRRNRY